MQGRGKFVKPLIRALAKDRNGEAHRRRIYARRARSITRW